MRTEFRAAGSAGTDDAGTDHLATRGEILHCVQNDNRTRFTRSSFISQALAYEEPCHVGRFRSPMEAAEVGNEIKVLIPAH